MLDFSARASPSLRNPTSFCYKSLLFCELLQVAIAICDYNTTLKSKRLLDESSEEMLDIIFSNKIIDLANIFNWDDCIQYYNQMIMGAGNAVVSFMESRESRMQAGIDQTIELFRKLN